MKANDPLTEQEVERPILTFRNAREEKARLVDPTEIASPDLETGAGEFGWRSYGGLEDRRMGSKAQFFGQHPEPESASVEPSGEEATPKSEVRCNAQRRTLPAAEGEGIGAAYPDARRVGRPPVSGGGRRPKQSPRRGAACSTI